MPCVKAMAALPAVVDPQVAFSRPRLFARMPQMVAQAQHKQAAPIFTGQTHPNITLVAKPAPSQHRHEQAAPTFTGLTQPNITQAGKLLALKRHQPHGPEATNIGQIQPSIIQAARSLMQPLLAAPIFTGPIQPSIIRAKRKNRVTLRA
jgi:hypothetical protein